jgi:diguanylate cyclase (GGDEF)-like protein
MASSRVLRVLLVERVPTAIGAGLDPRRFAIERTSSCEAALARLARTACDVLLLDTAALAPDARQQLQRLSAAAPDAAVVALCGTGDPDPERWLDAGVHETVPTPCALSQCGAGVDLLRRALLYAAEHKRAERRLADLALRDELTGLPNRRAFDGLLAGAFARARRHATRLAVLFVDLDGFKAINDRLGHAAGDAVLREVANRLRSTVRASDVAARLGGDEFAVVVEDVRSPADAATVARKLQLAIAQPIDAGGEAVRCTASVGVALGPEGRADADALLAAADAAMYERKRAQSGRRGRSSAANDANDAGEAPV